MAYLYIDINECMGDSLAKINTNAQIFSTELDILRGALSLLSPTVTSLGTQLLSTVNSLTPQITSAYTTSQTFYSILTSALSGTILLQGISSVGDVYINGMLDVMEDISTDGMLYSMGDITTDGMLFTTEISATGDVYIDGMLDVMEDINCNNVTALSLSASNSIYGTFIGDGTQLTLPDTTVTRFVTAIGNGNDSTINIRHFLNTRDVITQVYSSTLPYDVVYPTIYNLSDTDVRLIFNTPPALTAYKVVIMG